MLIIKTKDEDLELLNKKYIKGLKTSLISSTKP